MESRINLMDENLWLYEEPKLLEPITPSEAMELACRVALKGVGAVHKNPLVGAVIVDRGHRFLAAAAHLVFGQEHAEVNLINQIRKQNLEEHLIQSTLYITLEPCSHTGKTKPCVDSLAKIPLKEIIYGAIDPNPLVAGSGISFLEQKKIQCTFSPEFEAMGAHLLEHFRWNILNQTPFIGLKLTLDFFEMLKYDENRQKTNSVRVRDYGYWLRNSYEAILVESETIIIDNPSLAIIGWTPLCIVLDVHGQALVSRPISEHNLIAIEPSKTLWICEETFWSTKIGSTYLQSLKDVGVQFHSLEIASQLREKRSHMGDSRNQSMASGECMGEWSNISRNRKLLSL